MGHRHHGAGVGGQEVLEPGHRLGVEVVGGLVEEQQVGALEQEPAERDTAALATREGGHVLLARGTAQRLHGHLDGALELPGAGRLDVFLELALLRQQGLHLVLAELLGEARAHRLEAIEQGLCGGHPLDHVAAHVLGGIELGLLGQKADAHALGRPGLAVELGLEPGHDPEQRRLAGTVEAHHADLGARQEGERDFLQHLATAGIGLGQAVGDEDVLISGHDRLRAGRARCRPAYPRREIGWPCLGRASTHISTTGGTRDDGQRSSMASGGRRAADIGFRRIRHHCRRRAPLGRTPVRGNG